MIFIKVLEIFLQKDLTGFVLVRRIQNVYAGSSKSSVVGEFVNRNYQKLDYPRDVFLFKETSGRHQELVCLHHSSRCRKFDQWFGNRLSFL